MKDSFLKRLALILALSLAVAGGCGSVYMTSAEENGGILAIEAFLSDEEIDEIEIYDEDGEDEEILDWEGEPIEEKDEETSEDISDETDSVEAEPMQEAAGEEDASASDGEVLTGEVVPESGSSSLALPDNDALFAEYVEQVLYEDVPAVNAEVTDPLFETGSFPVSQARVADLSDNNRRVYECLKYAAGAIASGEQTNTVIQLSPVELLGPGKGAVNTDNGTITLVPSDLGLDRFYDVDGTSFSLTDEAKAAIDAFTAYSVPEAMTALLYDCPYELYWFDKTSYSFTKSAGASMAKSGDTETYTLSPVAVTVNMKVAKAYSAAKTTGTYVTDREMTTAAAETASEASRVAADVASKSAVEKVTHFKKYICGEVSYNSAAVSNNEDYGDPWQLIYVFDNDSSTNVVCEGYAKAFKYLCDLSGIPCYLIDGTMSGGTGAGNHMWNHVSLDDKNYLADVTNCDEGTIGADDKMFLKGVVFNVSEQPTGGYHITIGSTRITYAFSSAVLSQYTASNLTVSTSDYGLDKEVEDVESTIVAVTGIRLDADALSMDVGDVETLTATVTPSDATNMAVEWESSDDAIATVEDGIVTAIGPGVATITAAAADNREIKASCVVTVTNPVVSVEDGSLEQGDESQGDDNQGDDNQGDDNQGDDNQGDDNQGDGEPVTPEVVLPEQVPAATPPIESTSSATSSGGTSSVISSGRTSSATSAGSTSSGVLAAVNAMLHQMLPENILQLMGMEPLTTATAAADTETSNGSDEETDADVSEEEDEVEDLSAETLASGNYSISTSKSSLTFSKAGSKKTLVVKALSNGNYTKAKVKVSSSNKKVATVKVDQKTGKVTVTAKKKGSCTITVRIGKKTKKIKVTVKK